MSNTREALKQQFITQKIGSGFVLQDLPADASFRQYSRVQQDNKNYILMDANPEHEDVLPFATIAKFLHDNNFSAPEIYHQDTPNGFLLLEDFGDNHYSKVAQNTPDSEELLYKHAIDVLVNLHNTTIDIDLPHYDEDKLLNESMLMVDWYYKALHNQELPETLRDEYHAIWSKLLKDIHFHRHCMVLRDYHAENLMWLEDRKHHRQVGLLDFQDAVIGSVAYDLVSLTEDARRDLGPNIANKMINYYLEQTNYNRREFLSDYLILGAQRNCKIIGFCARKTVRDNDPRYLKYLPRVWQYIRNSFDNPLLSELKKWFDKTNNLSL